MVKKTCPQCRVQCPPRNVIKLYIDSSDLTTVSLDALEPQEMREKLSLQENLMAHKDQALAEARTQLSDIRKEMKAWQSQHKEMHKKLKSEQSVNDVLRKQLNSMHAELDEAKQNKKELESTKKKLATLEGVQRMLTGSKEEIDDVIASHKSSVSNLATFFTALKRDYEVVKEKRAVLVKEKDKLLTEMGKLRKQIFNKDDRISVLEIDVHSAEEEKMVLQKKVELLQAAIDSPGSRHALQRILESPMPDRSVNPTIDLGASPLLFSSHSKHDKPALPPFSTIQRQPRRAGTKRPSSKENIVFPVKMLKKEPFSSNVLKTGLKFAPRKNPVALHSSRNTKHH